MTLFRPITGQAGGGKGDLCENEDRAQPAGSQPRGGDTAAGGHRFKTEKLPVPWLCVLGVKDLYFFKDKISNEKKEAAKIEEIIENSGIL